MSTVQQVKQITKTKTAITTEQSQKLIQTMLTMSFGCLAFLRGLFPDDSFIDQKFVPEKCNKSYDKENTPSIRIKTLVRGRSEEADMFLDWVEKGVFTAIRLRYLKAILLGIFTDKNNPHDLLESYVFSLEYPTSNTVTLRINGQEEAISLLDSRKMMQQLMRRFIIITQSLDPLPKERYLSMRLLFNDNAPPDYQPQFFRDASMEPKTTIKVPDHMDMDAVSVGCLDTHHHTMAIKVLSLVDVDAQAREELNARAIDPFELVNQPVELKVDSIGQSKYNSQTTNMLQEYLRSSPEKVCPTQALPKDDESQQLSPDEQNSCECGMPCSVSFMLECETCKRQLHGLCYGNSRSSSIQQCISCIVAEERNFDPATKEFQMMMLLRKLYRYLKDNLNSCTSTSFLQETLFEGDNSESATSMIAEALSIFIQDKVILLDQERKRNAKGQFTKDSVFVDVDHQSIVTADGLLPPGKYALTLIPNSKNAQKCYTELCPASAAQVSAWTSAVRRSLAHLNRTKRHVNSSSSSINFSSLAIDEETLNPIPRGKRKNIRIEDDSVENYPDSLPNKVRKISVSKKTLKSAW
ncbi:AaceriACL029Wp [[Ashbya] aceris (nom. inval.)]|nr:AaceriACL029Wp [[Ashbya] aceris (nom. inval.)]